MTGSFQSRKSKILIIGKVPPPIGGVCVHVFRLIEALEACDFKFNFYNLGRNPAFRLIFEIVGHPAVHLHTSNPWFQLVVSLYCRVIGKPLMITYHGNLDRFGFWKNLATRISVRLATMPLVQNIESLIKARAYNQSARLISAFIAPRQIIPLSDDLTGQINTFRKPYRHIFCTNAWNVTFDKHKQEIYGITSLIRNMKKYKNSALIISDPSGKYRNFIKKHEKADLQNIFWISEPHDFLSVLRLSDAFIRNTTTDGTAMSIVEALWCGVPAYASNVVSRPHGCKIYGRIEEVNFEQELEKSGRNSKTRPDPEMFSGGIAEILSLYNEIPGRILKKP